MNDSLSINAAIRFSTAHVATHTIFISLVGRDQLTSETIFLFIFYFFLGRVGGAEVDIDKKKVKRAKQRQRASRQPYNVVSSLHILYYHSGEYQPINVWREHNRDNEYAYEHSQMHVRVFVRQRVDATAGSLQLLSFQTRCVCVLLLPHSLWIAGFFTVQSYTVSFVQTTHE